MEGKFCAFIYLFRHSFTHCSYSDYIKPLSQSRMDFSRKGWLNRAGYEMATLRVVTVLFFFYSVFNNPIPQCADFISQGHWRSILLLRMNRLNKLLTNILNPDFTVGFIPANPSVCTARLPEVLRS